ncbi:hypothetical protein [Burkholderia sp. NRF60-BP8]|uniref:hypothetical protein n=1 Tax=Burkholderia sp. NRF60-BP8 TaxID=1637853 RepID=UPI00131EEFEE|nr:hypothetical protein [Burkholderia sp. NRF60-BP8]
MPIAGMRAAAEHRVSIGLRAIVQVEASFDAKLRMLAAAEILVAAARPEDRIRQAAALLPRDPSRVPVRQRVFESMKGGVRDACHVRRWRNADQRCSRPVGKVDADGEV